MDDRDMTARQSFYDTPSPAGLTGIKAWLLTHDHKRLALMYLWAVFFWVVLGTFSRPGAADGTDGNRRDHHVGADL